MNAREPSDPVEDDPCAEMRLESPSVEFWNSYSDAMAELEDEWAHPAGMTAAEFPAYVQRLHDQAIGRNLKEGHVPSIELWMIDSDGFAGRIILGLSFFPSEERVGNHVGYVVRPSKRGKGYASKALRVLLKEARMRGIDRSGEWDRPIRTFETEAGIDLVPPLSRWRPNSI